MFGFFVAAASAAGLFVLAARRRRFGFGFGRRGLYRLFERLDTSPGQEKLIREALDELGGVSRDLWREAREARPELAELLRADRLDEASVEAWFSGRRRSLDTLGGRALQTLTRIHDVLDTRQRRMLAELVERGAYFGPFGRRAHHC